MPTPLTPETCKMGVFIQYRENGVKKYAIIRGRTPEIHSEGAKVKSAMVVLESHAFPTGLIGITFEELSSAEAEVLSDKDLLEELCNAAEFFSETVKIIEKIDKNFRRGT